MSGPRLERIRAIVDARISARLSKVRPLSFAAPVAEADIPGHVRAGSAIRRWGARLVVVQDDVHALAILDEARGIVTPMLLPAGADGRRTFGEALGNKALKMDLEACITLRDGRLVALGSGSTAQRERIVVVDGAAERVIDAHDLYAHLRDARDFAGLELNVEGAVIAGDVVRLFQRGNGAPGAAEPVNAAGDVRLADFVAWLDGGPTPKLAAIRQFDLGAIDGVRFGFTDATVLPDGRIAFLAGAEDSPDTYRDGRVVGCRFGILDGDDARMVDIHEESGAATRLKLEGIDWVGEREGAWELVVVADLDDPNAAALVATLHVRVSR
jgi:hypothetical protein